MAKGTVVPSYNRVWDLSSGSVSSPQKTERSGMKSFPKLEHSYCSDVKQTRHSESPL